MTLQYDSKWVKLSFVVADQYDPGDIAQLYTNSGDGDVSYTTPANSKKYELFPDGAGWLGYGHASHGQSPHGWGESFNTPGYGHLPHGQSPHGHGANVIEIYYEVTTPGYWKFAVKITDAAGNKDSGTPEVEDYPISLIPKRPTALKKVSYNSATDVLVLST